MKDFKPEILYLNPEQLVPYVKNAKVHSNEQVDKIAGQIAAFGFDQPIVVDANHVIIKGHGRREAALRLGLQQVPVIVQELDEYQAMAARIADNKVAESPWDPEMLKFELGTLQTHDFDLKLTAVELGLVDAILNPPTSETQFSEQDHKSVTERRDQYDNSDMRQIILVTDPDGFEKLMKQFSELQTEFGVETNIEVVERLLEFYATNRDRVSSG